MNMKVWDAMSRQQRLMYWLGCVAAYEQRRGMDEER